MAEWYTLALKTEEVFCSVPGLVKSNVELPKTNVLLYFLNHMTHI